jgi:hypothetical protein
MNSIIQSDTYGQLVEYQDHLDREAGQSRTFASLCKGSGLAGIGLSGLALFTLPGWGGLALAGSAIGYLGMVLIEARKTGKVMPLPFVTLGLETVMKGVANAPGSNDDDGDELTHYHYLSAQEKSDYALLLLLGPEIAAALETLPTDQARRVAFSQMRRRFHQTYSRHIKDNPDMLAMGADKSSLVEFILADADGLRQLATQPAAPALTESGSLLPELPAGQPEPEWPRCQIDHTQTIDTPAEELPTDPWHEPAPASGSPVIGPVTRANAIDVQSHPLANVTMPKAEIITATAKRDESEADWDLIGELAKNLRSSLVIGVPGAGKGMLMSHFVRRVKALYPELKIVGIDPKNDPKETGYWTDGFDKVFRADNEKLDNQGFVEWLQSCLDTFRMMPDGKLLIWDEHTISCRRWASYDRSLPKGAPGQRFNEIVDYIISVCSSGDSRRNYIVAVGQVPNASDMGMSGGTRGISKPVGIVCNHDRAAVQQFMSTTFTPSPQDGIEGLYRIMDKSPVGRAIFCWNRGKWEPMPRLENLSGYDRDSRQHIGEPKQIAQVVGPEPGPVESPAPVASVDEFSVDDLILPVPAPAASTEFVDGTLIPALERAKATAPQSEMMIDLVNWLRGRESVTLTDASQAGWSKKAKTNNWLPDRTGDTIAAVLAQLAGDKYQLLAPEPDGKTWRVTLS